MKIVAIEDGLIGWVDNGTAWTSFYWLEKVGASYVEGNTTNTHGISTSTQIKSLVSNGSFPSTDWATNIDDGYPYLKVFDDTSIWLRDSNGEPYLKDNPPQ